MIYLQKPLKTNAPSSSTTMTVKDYLDLHPETVVSFSGMKATSYDDWIGSWNKPVAAMHPHNNCSVCHGVESGKLDEQAQFEALLAAYRTSVQDTLAALARKGYEIRKKPD